jgi:hypothetical protein
LDWVAQEDQAAVGLAVVGERVEVEALARREAVGAVAPVCGILGCPVAAEVVLGQARVAPVQEVDPEAVAGVWAVLEGAAEAEPEDLALAGAVVLGVVEVPELAVELAASELAVEVAEAVEQDPVVLSVEVAERDPAVGVAAVLGLEAPRELHRENG